MTIGNSGHPGVRTPGGPGRRPDLPRLAAGLALVLTLAAAGCERDAESPVTAPAPAESAADGPPQFVGRAVCAECHADAVDRWTGSHHDLAMQPADAATVLGDFDDARYTYAGVSSVFSRRDGRFFVETDGPEGELAEYEIVYTFGVEPLQQYLIEFPDGRLQALGIAWDTRPAEAGGQRWFHLYPDERVDAADELHWTRPSQNWNYMCADCHSTGYRKNYDAATDRFASTWSDIDVACEACHGPASRHVARARDGAADGDGGLIVPPGDAGRRWLREPGEATARLVGALAGGDQVEACGRCHARRAAIRAEYAHGRPLADSFVPARLTEPLYFPDGQIRDEVYVYGSFLQSRMHAAGVICTDCHDPHAATTKLEGDALCAQCHAADVYAVDRHHRHGDPQGDSQGDSQGGAAPACVDCHMPSRTYMVVDDRRDHSFRVPRPDLAESLGVTDACDACHADRPDGWSAAAVRDWLGRDASGYQQFAGAIRAADAGEADAVDRLLDLLSSPGQPAILRATALGYLADYPDPRGVTLAGEALADPSPLVRLGALEALVPMPQTAKRRLLMPVLDDPIRSVRTEAARQLAGLPPASLSPEERQRLTSVLAEYVEIQQDNADRPEARLNLALVYADAGDPATAEQQLEAARRLHPGFEPAYVNLADLNRARGDEARAREVLEAGLKARPDSAALHYAMGLLVVRTEGGEAALPWLERAAELAPGNTRFQYVRGVALNDAGRPDEAIAALERAHAARPADAEVLYVLALYSRDAGAIEDAAAYASRLQALRPHDPRATALVEELAAGAADRSVPVD